MEDVNKEIDEVVEEMKDKMDDLSAEAEKADGKLAEKAKEIRNKANDVLKQASDKLLEIKDTIKDPEERKKAVEFVKAKSQEIYEVSMNKIKEITESEQFKKTVNDVETFAKDYAGKAADAAKDAYGKAMENENVKKAADKVAGYYNQGKKAVDDFMAKPETQKAIDSAKDKTIDVAEKAVAALKDWLKPSEK